MFHFPRAVKQFTYSTICLVSSRPPPTRGPVPGKEVAKARTVACNLQQYLRREPSGSQPWRLQPDMPTVKEITSAQHLVNPGLLEAQNWSTEEEYLSAKYTLLREDGCWPLRQCVNELRDRPSLMEADTTTRARIYEAVS